MKHFQEKKIDAQKAAKASEMHQKRITGFIAKMIKTFWSNVEKVSFYSNKSLLHFYINFYLILLLFRTIICNFNLFVFI